MKKVQSLLVILLAGCFGMKIAVKELKAILKQIKTYAYHALTPKQNLKRLESALRNLMKITAPDRMESSEAC